MCRKSGSIGMSAKLNLFGSAFGSVLKLVYFKDMLTLYFDRSSARNKVIKVLRPLPYRKVKDRGWLSNVYIWTYLIIARSMSTV